ncbi:MAG TPA: hypothetical protein VHP33_17470 [Polyangiaceae bacterium]|nr:hypothetical protein [Polyangiaceae bacterium]
MTEHYISAISSFEAMPEDLPAIGVGPGASRADDLVQLHVAPAGVSVKGRYWRDGHFLKATVHIQAAGTAPKTITAQVDLRPIAHAVKRWHVMQHQRGARVGGWPGSFIKKVKNIAKSKLVSQVAHSVKSVVQSKITGAVVGAAAVVFPPVGVPAAAAYATANAALATLDKAVQIKNQAQAVLSHGSSAQKASLQAKAPVIKEALTKAVEVKRKLREIAQRASRGDIGARKTARIFSHVMQHRQRVNLHGQKLQGKNATTGLLVTEYGKVVPGTWLLTAAAHTGLPLLQAAAQPALRRALPAPAVRQVPRQLPPHRRHR